MAGRRTMIARPSGVPDAGSMGEGPGKLVFREPPSDLFAVKLISSLTSRGNQPMFYPDLSGNRREDHPDSTAQCRVRFVHMRRISHSPTTKAPPPVRQKDGPRINREIHAREVQLIDAEGQKSCVVETIQAQQSADEAGLDLVETVPTANPPVWKIFSIMANSAFWSRKIRGSPEEAEDRRDGKEIKLRPGNVDDHDYGVKMKVRRFFEMRGGCKVGCHAALPRPRDGASGSGGSACSSG